MAFERFVEAASKKPTHVYRGKDYIPGTDKVRTYCGNSELYSREGIEYRIENNKYYPKELKNS